MHDWSQVTKDVTAQLKNLRADAPEVMRAFASLAQAASTAEALDAKTKELIALGSAIAVQRASGSDPDNATSITPPVEGSVYARLLLAARV